MQDQIHRLYELSELCAAATSRKKWLEHMRKVVRAKLMIHYEGMGTKSLTAQARNAEADPKYQEAIDKLRIAEHEAEMNNAEREAVKIDISVQQTMSADLRAEMKHINR